MKYNEYKRLYNFNSFSIAYIKASLLLMEYDFPVTKECNVITKGEKQKQKPQERVLFSF